MLPFIVIRAYYYSNNELRLSFFGMQRHEYYCCYFELLSNWPSVQNYSFGDNWCQSFYTLEAVLVSQPTISEQRIE